MKYLVFGRAGFDMELQRASNARIKFLQGLKLKKNRLKYGCFMAEGDKVVKDILKDKIFKVRGLYGLSSWFDGENKLRARGGFPLATLTAKDLSRISSLNSAPAVCIECEIPTSKVVPKASKILFLDGINNPGNVGTILRCCDWFGVEQVVLTPDCADVYNPKTIQAAMGSFGRVAIAHGDAGCLQEHWPHVPVYFATLEGTDLDKMSLPKSWALAIGSESHGLSVETLATNGIRVTIPKRSESNIDSLNAAIAAAVLMAKLTG